MYTFDFMEVWEVRESLSGMESLKGYIALCGKRKSIFHRRQQDL